MFDFDAWKAELVHIPTEKLADAWMSVRAEQKSREARAIAGDQVTGIIYQLRDNGALPAPVADAESPEGYSEWVSPGTDQTKMPLKGDRFYRKGRVWESLVDFNSWEPGAEGTWSAWSDITDLLFPADGGEPVEYVDGQHYVAGQRVLFNGDVYECVNDHYAAPGWTPVNAHANWQKVAE